MHLAHAAASHAPEERVASDAYGSVLGHVARACLVLGVLAAATSALAQDRSVLVVRADPARRALAEALAERIVGGALGDGEIVVRAPAPTDADGDVGWLETAIVTAEDEFARLALDDAWAALDTAVRRLDAEGAPDGSRDRLVELFLLAARIAAARGDLAAENEAVSAAVAIAPELRIDLDQHPPALADRVEAARAARTDCPVALELAPADAAVAVDGGPPEPPPSTLPCGRHWLTVSAPNHGPRSLVVPAGSDGVTERIALDVSPGDALAAAGDPFAPLPPAVSEGAAAMGAEPLVLDVAVLDGRLEVRVGSRSASAPLEATPDEVLALLRAPVVGAVRDDTAPIAIGVTLGSAVVLAAVLTTILVLTAPTDPPGYELRGHVVYLP